MVVHVNPRFVNDWVKRDVEENLDRLFMFDNVFFGQKMHLGQVYQFALGVDGVDYVTVQRFSDRDFAVEAPKPIGEDDALNVLQEIQISDIKLPKKGRIIVSGKGGISSVDRDTEGS